MYNSCFQRLTFSPGRPTWLKQAPPRVRLKVSVRRKADLEQMGPRSFPERPGHQRPQPTSGLPAAILGRLDRLGSTARLSKEDPQRVDPPGLHDRGAGEKIYAGGFHAATAGHVCIFVNMQSHIKLDRSNERAVGPSVVMPFAYIQSEFSAFAVVICPASAGRTS